MTRLRDLLLWAALWAVYLLLVQPVITSGQGVAIVWMGGGIAAGLLIVLEVRRWWPLLLVTAIALAVGYRNEIEGWVLALQVAVDIVAIVAFARVVRAHRRDLSGLGADVPWVAFGAIGAAAIRLLPALVIALASEGTAGYSVGAATELGLSTVVGLIAGSATVLGLGRWTWGAVRLRENREMLLGTAVLIAVLVLIFVTPFGTAVPGAQYLVVPLLLASAVRYPVPLTAFLTGLTVLAISVATASGTGPYDIGQPATSEQVFATQVYLLVVAVSVFVLASVVSERRLAEDSARRSSAMLAAVFRETPVPGAWVTLAADRYPVIREANPAFLDLVGLTGEGVRGVRLSSLLTPTEPADVVDLDSGRDMHTMGPDGSGRWLRPTLSGVRRPHRASGRARRRGTRGVRRPRAGGRHRRPGFRGAAAPAGASRQPHRPAEPCRADRAARGCARGRLRVRPGRPAHPRHRRPQGRQQRARAPDGRPAHHPDGPAVRRRPRPS